MIKSIKVALRMVIIFGIFLNLHIFAQFADPESNLSKPHHNAHQNHIALFAGATTQLEQKGTKFSIGTDYVRYLDSEAKWGISIFGEAIFAEHTEYLLGLPVYYHFT